MSALPVASSSVSLALGTWGSWRRAVRVRVSGASRRLPVPPRAASPGPRHEPSMSHEPHATWLMGSTRSIIRLFFGCTL